MREAENSEQEHGKKKNRFFVKARDRRLKAGMGERIGPETALIEKLSAGTGAKVGLRVEDRQSITNRGGKKVKGENRYQVTRQREAGGRGWLRKSAVVCLRDRLEEGKRLSGRRKVE